MIINEKEFKAVPGYMGYYASDDGEIYSNKSSKILRQRIFSQAMPYYCVQLSINNKIHNIPVHKLVALAWLELPENYNLLDALNAYKTRALIVDHFNGNKLDNKASNLRWCTSLENVNYENWNKDMRSEKLKGNKNACGHRPSKHKPYRYIYTYNNKEYTLNELAKELNCSKSKITESFRCNLGLVKQGRLTRVEEK